MGYTNIPEKKPEIHKVTKSQQKSFPHIQVTLEVVCEFLKGELRLDETANLDDLLGQWLNFKLSGITCLVGKN